MLRSGKMRCVRGCLVLAGALLVLELVTRVGSWLYYGRDPYYLLYGFVSWTSGQGDGHSDKFDGYFKYPPNRPVRHGLPEPGRINNHGFRGADFALEKAPGAFRIVCMGGSSTFGYTNRDQGTYPVLLQRRFEEGAPGRPVEVLNAGVAHFNTDQQVALLGAEVLGWSPDVITLYCAYNDAFYPRPENGWQAATQQLDEYSAAFAALRKVLNALLGEVIFYQWSGYPERTTSAELAAQIALHRARTRGNLETIATLAGTRGVRIVLVRQPMTLWYKEHPETPRTGVTYEGEVDETRARLEREGAISDWEAVLLVHHALLAEVDAFAAAHGFPLVDNVALVDAHPQGLATYVHLGEAANERLAEALHGVLAPLVPGE